MKPSNFGLGFGLAIVAASSVISGVAEAANFSCNDDPNVFSVPSFNLDFDSSRKDKDENLKSTVPFKFKSSSFSDDSYKFGRDKRGDRHGSKDDDRDDDGNVRPVPVPAIVPGIALAGIFFGGKTLKRNKKNVQESVA